MFRKLTECLSKIFCCYSSQTEDEKPDVAHEVKLEAKPRLTVAATTSITPIRIKLSDQSEVDTLTRSSPIKVLFQKIKVKKGRTTSNYKNNFTAALQLPLANQELDKISENYTALLHNSKEYIKEHAARRIDLYFYLLIAIYNTKLRISQGDTILQHGKGRKSSDRKGLTHACHSSLFPTIISDKNHKDDITVLLLGTHFMDSLNSTVELPIFANQLDSELEGKISNPSLFRQKSTEILQKVSNGDIDPIIGFRLFLKEMSDTLDLLKSAKRIKKGSTPYLTRTTGSIPKQIKVNLIELVRAGAFCSASSLDQENITNDYIYLLLRLKPEEIAECQKSIDARHRVFFNKIYIIQNEINDSKSHYSKKWG